MEPFKSVRTDVPATLLMRGEEETAGRVVRMAPTGLLVEGVRVAAERTPVVIYLQSGERFEGTAKQVGRETVSVAVKPTATRRVKLAECMLRQMDGSPLPTRVDRALRYRVDASQVACVLDDGTEVPCRVMDVSLTGLGIAMDHVLTLGDRVRVGKVHAQVIRQTDLGYGLQVIADDTGAAAQSDDQVIQNALT